MIRGMFKKAVSETQPKVLPVNPIDVVVTFRKLDRVLQTSVTMAHMDATEKMFERMIKHYHFSDKDIESPLVTGMWDEIQRKRQEIALGDHNASVAA